MAMAGCLVRVRPQDFYTLRLCVDLSILSAQSTKQRRAVERV